ncbi:hypothetical protein AVEN_103114-1 [Araneus ventricosus]|uniref:Uncharacterized protein n=1 Tax=Araneus ventricosus TaxID=182803 RepID=A0A4Y2HV71_ARAVE|nr:hypothetical protein AVEN_103114-1 [Araneus ventricosus]
MKSLAVEKCKRQALKPRAVNWILINKQAVGVFTAGLISFLCQHVYLMTGRLVKSYRTNLKRSLRTRVLPIYLFREIEDLKALVSVVETVDEAFNLCSLVLYAALCASTFVTINIFMSVEILPIGMKVMTAWNCIMTMKAFYNITTSGSSITEEGEVLKKTGLECSGNECADQLAKEDITKGDSFLLPKPLSYLKAEIKSAALSIWQGNWDNGETGRSTHDIVPRVSNKPAGWKREEIMFVTGHGPFA